MNYFVCNGDGEEIATNLNKDSAIKKAKSLYESGDYRVSIGTYKHVDGKLAYSLSPLFFYV